MHSPEDIKGVVVLLSLSTNHPFALPRYVSRQTNVTDRRPKDVDVDRHPPWFPQTDTAEAKANQRTLSPRTQRSTQHQRPDPLLTVSLTGEHPLLLDVHPDDQPSHRCNPAI